jgi:uncharacterized membrane protein YfcA
MLTLLIYFVLGGLFSGFTAGLFGIGGGSFLIPLFIFLLPKLGASSAQVMHQAVATSLAIIIPSTLSASFKQYQQGNIETSILKTWIPFVALGLLLVILVFDRISSTALQYIFIGYLFLCVLYMLFKRVPSADEVVKKVPFMSCALVGFLVGALSVLLGIGGGTVTIPFFTYYRHPLKKAIALSSVTGVFIGVLGTIFMIVSSLHETHLAKFSWGYVNILSVVMLAPFCIISAAYGAKVSDRLPESVLKILYALFLMSIIIFIYSKM